MSGFARAVSMARDAHGVARGRDLLALFLGLAVVSCTGVSHEDEATLVAFGRLDQGAAGLGGRLPLGSAGLTAAGAQSLGAAAGAYAIAEVEPSTFVHVEEVKFDPPGTDGNFEFVELRGDPNTSLSGYWLAAIEGDEESNRGQLDVVVDLRDCGVKSCRFDANGLLLLVPDLVATPPPCSAEWRLSSEIAKGALENGTTTLIVLRGPEVLGGVDWDTDDDGVLEVSSVHAIADAVAWTDGGASDLTYSRIKLGPKPKPQAAWRCAGAADEAEWRYAQLSGDASSLLIDLENSYPASQSDPALTPGSDNTCKRAASVSAGASGAGGVGPSVANAGCSGLSWVPHGTSGGSSFVTSGGVPNSGQATATVVAGASATTARGGTGGTGAVPEVFRAGAGGRVAPTSPTTTSPGATALLAVASGCAGTIYVATANVSDAGGTSSWWSPQPFAVSQGAQAGKPPGGGGYGTGGAAPKGTAQPALPSGCTINDRTPRPIALNSVLGLLLFGLSRRKRGGRRQKSCGQTARANQPKVSGRCSGPRPRAAHHGGGDRERLRQAACSAIRASANV